MQLTRPGRGRHGAGASQVIRGVGRTERREQLTSMRALADAIVYAVTYINLWEDEREEFLDDDVGALESIAARLDKASPQEQDALAEAAERALAQELASPHPRDKFIADYRNWMEDMFGEPWNGNRRSD